MHEPTEVAGARRRTQAIAIAVAAAAGFCFALAAPAAANAVPLPDDSGLTISIAGSPDPVVGGETITWTVEVANAGTATYTGANWSASLCDDALAGPAEIAPGAPPAAFSCTSTAPVDGEGSTTNTVSFVADSDELGTSVEASAEASVVVDDVVRDFYTTIYGTPDPVEPGGEIEWVLAAENADVSNTLMTDLRWESEECGPGSFPGVYPPGAETPVVTCTSIAPASGQATNTTTFFADVPALGTTIDAEVEATVDVLAVGLTPALTVSPDPVAAGGEVTWTVQLQNTGDAMLTDAAWSTSPCGPASFPGELAAGSATPEVTCTTTAPASGTVDGSVEFTAIVPGTGETVFASATATATVTPAVEEPPPEEPPPVEPPVEPQTGGTDGPAAPAAPAAAAAGSSGTSDGVSVSAPGTLPATGAEPSAPIAVAGALFVLAAGGVAAGATRRRAIRR